MQKDRLMWAAIGEDRGRCVGRTTYALAAGDLIYTGTPAGVGPLVPGDSILGRISGLPDLTLDIT